MSESAILRTEKNIARFGEETQKSQIDFPIQIEKMKMTKNGKRNIPKNICQLSNNDGIIETDSTKLNKRPYERLEMLA